jgi:hypothetical protein
MEKSIGVPPQLGVYLIVAVFWGATGGLPVEVALHKQSQRPHEMSCRAAR